jgi:hypothetical protein
MMFVMVDAHFDIYYRRATQLAEARNLCKDCLESYAAAVALLAVHSAISYSDAVILGLGGTRPKSENHRDAITILKRVCKHQAIDYQQGVRQFEKLLGAKSDISYGPDVITDEKVMVLCTAAERFEAWSEKTIKVFKVRER